MEKADSELNPEEYYFKSNIKEWGVSHQTLEEVFIKITDKKNKK